MTVETANRLYELRKKHNLSQEELAEKLGVSRQAVSKWERSEASPDTDNLIGLAKIYGLSLDELIYGKSGDAEDNKDTIKDSNNSYDEVEPHDDEKVYINIEDKNNKVTIGSKGIVVEDEDGETVTIGLSGIKIKSQSPVENNRGDGEDSYDDHIVTFDEDGHVNISVRGSEQKKTKFWLEVPYAVICTITYLLFGFYNICGGWAHSWIIFITIPIYYSLVEAIYNRKFTEFAYPVFTAFMYLYFGLYHGNWHPSWIIFVTIAIYYPLAEAIDRKIKEKKAKDE